MLNEALSVGYKQLSITMEEIRFNYRLFRFTNVS